MLLVALIMQSITCLFTFSLPQTCLKARLLAAQDLMDNLPLFL